MNREFADNAVCEKFSDSVHGVGSKRSWRLTGNNRLSMARMPVAVLNIVYSSGRTCWATGWAPSPSEREGSGRRHVEVPC